MLGSIVGKLQFKSNSFVIVAANGVGYKIYVNPGLILNFKIDQDLTLLLHTYVREDQINLYGFSTLDELEFFELLLTVSGVGPKSALGIMSLASVDMIKSAIVSEDPSVFTKVSGIGRKTAERVIVELEGKLKGEADKMPVAREHSDAVDALLALGYSQQQAREALKAVPNEITKLKDKVRFVLKSFSK